MKKVLKTLIICVLCLCIASPTVAFAAEKEVSYKSASDYVFSSRTGVELGEEAQKNILLSKIVNCVSNFFINDVLGTILNIAIPSSAAVLDYEEFDLDSYDNFYAGMDEFIDEPQGKKVWSLGYGKASVLPDDFGEKRYAKGAYIPYVYGNEMYKDEEGNYEDLMARVIVMNDGSGRGNVVFISIDAMGLANADVRLIREGLKDIAEKNNIVSINVSCTHIHTGIDSQGVWTDPIGCLVNNIISDDVKYGVPREFINSLVEGSKEAVEEALADIEMTDATIQSKRTFRSKFRRGGDAE